MWALYRRPLCESIMYSFDVCISNFDMMCYDRCDSVIQEIQPGHRHPSLPVLLPTDCMPVVTQGRVLKYLGRACQPQLCEESCSQAHEFYQAKVIPPDDRSVAAGRPVQLQLDLADRLRCQTLEDLMQLEPEQLQVG
jgi:hypothetical protein